VLSGERSETQGGSYTERLNGILAKWLQGGREKIEEALSALLKAAAAAALALAVAQYEKELGLTLEPGDEVLARLSRWAREEASAFLDRCAQAIDESLERIIALGLQEGVSPADIASRIRDFFKNWVKRGKELAADEAILAEEHGYYEANAALGATTKRWVTVIDPHVCEVCKTNEAQGDIPIEEPFASGHFYPPAHSSCRCTVEYDGVTRESAMQTS
jgi:hypothetical protein